MMQLQAREYLWDTLRILTRCSFRRGSTSGTHSGSLHDAASGEGVPLGHTLDPYMMQLQAREYLWDTLRILT
ncbi:hypothetical protein DPMN_130627 [Dreissena polymorpha]|uniref:Uncharacterized protein n=1 Tax=Dreissena polymorpha TaxID=45954 RepID=A0A9D4H385_DREPO|nr:hypothetical protein DPMN_130627 [Dreissena polymorpha]